VRITVIGARGFIGSAIAAHAERAGHDVVACSHDAVPETELGTIVYCSGVAWGADAAPLEAYELHAAVPLRLLQTRDYDRAVYVSSTRVYDRSPATTEDTPAAILTAVAGDVYAASKLAGEGIVLAAKPQNRVVRASNVYGASLRSQLFLSDIVRQAVRTGCIDLRSSLDSSKDYISVDDLAALVLRIAAGSRERVYNIAAGCNTTHAALIEAIVGSSRVQVRVPDDAPTVNVPEIDVSRVMEEFSFVPRDVVDDIPDLIRAFRADG
jgi:nucleoside-diphosphate-sugar epimerase